jgi:hypothetical protein
MQGTLRLPGDFCLLFAFWHKVLIIYLAEIAGC